jgi:hypothetical protein
MTSCGLVSRENFAASVHGHKATAYCFFQSIRRHTLEESSLYGTNLLISELSNIYVYTIDYRDRLNDGPSLELDVTEAEMFVFWH